MQDSFRRLRTPSSGYKTLLANLTHFPLQAEARVVSYRGKFRVLVRDGLNSPLEEYVPLSAKVGLQEARC